LRRKQALQRWNFKAALAGLAVRNFKAASKIASVKFRRKVKFKKRLASPRQAGRAARDFVIRILWRKFQRREILASVNLSVAQRGAK